MQSQETYAPAGPKPPAGNNGSRPDHGGDPRWRELSTAPGLRRGWTRICLKAIVAVVLFLAWLLAWPPLQLGPRGGVLSLEVFAVWSLAFLPGWLYIRFLGQRAGSPWDEYVLNLHRLRWDRPRHLPEPPVNSEFHGA